MCYHHSIVLTVGIFSDHVMYGYILQEKTECLSITDKMLSVLLECLTTCDEIQFFCPCLRHSFNKIIAPISTLENLSNKRTLVTLAVAGFVVRVTLALVLAGLALF